MQLNSQEIRRHFPILSRQINVDPLIYLDNAATSQKPECVLRSMDSYYRTNNANAHRSMHVLSEEATEVLENSRTATKQFINAHRSHEVIFTKSTTEGINLVARSWGEANLKKGDTVLLSLLEHHSNIVPWLQLKEKIGINVKWIGVHDDGTLDEDDAHKKLKDTSVKLLALTCVSNVLGTITPYKELTKLAHQHDVTVLLDAAQLAPHAPIDVQKIDCDFLVLSGHKIYGPMGIGVLYGKEDVLSAMPSFLGGGGMIERVTTEQFTATHIPQKFEAGTSPIAEAAGLHAAIDFLNEVGWQQIQTHEKDLLTFALKELEKLDCVKILGPKDPDKISGCISFVHPPVHPHDLTDWMGKQGICLRAGHHCAQPLHDRLNVKATTRMSFGIYNTKEEIQATCEAIQDTWRKFDQ